MSLGNEQLSFLEKAINIVEKHGVFKILKTALVLIVFFFAIYNGYNVNNIIDKVIIKKENEHNIALKYRQNINPEIDRILGEILINTGGNRVFILEMHNGTNNTSGLPFFYGEMTYEKVTPNIAHIDDDYKNINLSRFSFSSYMNTHHSWHGYIEELEKIDNKLSSKMKENNVNYFILSCIHGVNNAIGFVGVTYCDSNEPFDVNRGIGYVNLSAQKLSKLLDMKNINFSEIGKYNIYE